MFCRMCGKVIEDDAKICAHCGADLADEPEAAPNEPEVDFTLNTQPVAQPKKKSKKGIAVLLAVVAVVVAAAVALAVFLPGLLSGKSGTQETFNRTMGAASAQLTDSLDTLLSSYGKVQGTELKNMAYSGQLKLELSSTLMEILNMAAGEDLQWLSELSFDMLVVQREDLMMMDLGLSLGEQYILGMELYNDLANMRMWLGLPELNEVFLYQDLGGLGTSVDELKLLVPPYEQLFAILAEEKETTIKLAEKLIDTLMGCIETQDSQQQTMTVGSITKEVTVVHGYSNNKTCYEKTWELAQWLSEHDEFFDLLDQFDEMLHEYASSIDADLSNQIRDELTQMLEAGAPEDEGATLDHYFYMDADGSLLGYKAMRDGRLLCDLLCLTDGDAFVFQLVTEENRITADIVTKNGVSNGSIKVEDADGQAITFQIENVRIQDEVINGTVTIEVPQEAIREAFGNSGFAPATKLRITMNGDQNLTEVKLEVLMADMPMLTLTASGQMLEEYEIYPPETGVDMTDPYAANEWISTMNYDQVLSNILAAGVPEELINEMISAMAGQ